MAPNEFQGTLRQVLAAVTDKARANKVRLPENFFLGFDEFSAALPGMRKRLCSDRNSPRSSCS